MGRKAAMTLDGLMLRRSLLFSIALTCSASLAGAETVDFPEDDFWRTLTRNLYDGPPDFEALARRSDTYRQADEFARGEVLAQEVARLQGEYEGFGDDLQVRLRAQIRLGDYNAARGGFPISLFTPGTYLDARFNDDAKVMIEPGRVVIEELSQAKSLRLGFGNDPEFVGRMFALQSPMARARMPEGQIDVGFTGAGLDCGTPDLLDACGVLILDRVDGNWILTGAEGVVELETADYMQAFPEVVGDDLSAFQRTDQHVAFAANWLAGRTDEMASGGYAMSARYTLGEALDDGPHYVRPTEPWRLQSVNHEVTAYAVDGAKGRTPLIFTMAQPPSDQPSSMHPQIAPASRSSATPPPFGTMSYGN